MGWTALSCKPRKKALQDRSGEECQQSHRAGSGGACLGDEDGQCTQAAECIAEEPGGAQLDGYGGS